MIRVLVLDGHQRSTLAIVRSLGRRETVEILVAEARIPSLAGRSRFVAGELTYPDPAASPDDFVAWIRSTIERLRIEVIIPTTDITTMLLAPLRHDLTSTVIACAPQEAYELASDKAQLVALARSIGIDVPATTSLSGRRAIDDHLSTARFPLVLKPARSKISVDGTIVSTGVHVAASLESAQSYLSKQRWLETMPCLAQEFIAGHGAGVFTCFNRGEPVAWFAHRRLREKPPSGGVSVLSESVEVPVAQQRAAARLLSAVGWHGLAMVEFRVAPDGVPYLMEINARPWGSMQLAVDAGVDFPGLLLDVATGAPEIHASRTPRRGRRLRWLLGDFDNLLLQMRDPRKSASSKLHAVAGFIGTSFDMRCHQEVFRWSDPRPAIHEFHQWFRALR